MALQDHGHECDRFRLQGMECPFVRAREDADTDDDDRRSFPRFPLAVPARREQEGRSPLIFPHQQPEFVKRLEQVAAIQTQGGLQSIPAIGRMLGEVPVDRLALSGRGHEATLAGLAAIVIMLTSRALRSSGFGTGLQAVRISEQRAAKGLSKVVQQSRFGGGPARSQGRGGFLMPADKFRAVVRPPRIKRRPGGGLVAGFDSFSETGFP